MKEYDYLVIGTGSGLNIVQKLATQNKKIALAEENRFGGTCLNRGCIPSKMLIYAAQLLGDFSKAKKFHIKSEKIQVDFKALVREVNTKIEKESEELASFYRSSDVDFFSYHACFVDKKVVKAGDKIFKAKKIILDIGSSPFIPPIPGLDKTPFITSDEALKLEKAPKHLIIIGGGYIGLELAHLFSSFGSKVTILEKKSLLLKEDKDIIKTFRNELLSYVNLKEKAKVTKVTYQNKKFKAFYTCEHKECSITGDLLLVATGRFPPTQSLNLEKTAIKTDQKGFIQVNNHLQTTEKDVWALGDCIHDFQLKHLANYEARYLANYLLGKIKKPISYPPLPYAIFSKPEIATVGLNETELKKKNRKYIIKKASYEQCGKGWLMKEQGLLKLLFSSKEKKLLGATMIGKEASELIQILTVFTTQQATLDQMQDVIFIHPTMAELIKKSID